MYGIEHCRAAPYYVWMLRLVYKQSVDNSLGSGSVVENLRHPLPLLCISSHTYNKQSSNKGIVTTENDEAHIVRTNSATLLGGDAVTTSLLLLTMVDTRTALVAGGMRRHARPTPATSAPAVFLSAVALLVSASLILSRQDMVDAQCLPLSGAGTSS
jgi:hypothetical protein